MRSLIWGTFVVIGLVVLGAGVGMDRDALHAQSGVERVVPTGDLIALTVPGGEGLQQVVSTLR